MEREGKLHVEHWQDRYGDPKDLGEVWRLTKTGRVARCRLVGHPLGTEARLSIDGDDLPFSQVCKTTAEIADVTDGWRRGFEGKGWQRDG